MSYNSFQFGGVNTANYGVYISGNDAFGVPERVVEVQSVPGKNGDIVIDQGHYANQSVTYTCFVRKGMMQNGIAFLDAIKSKHGYQRFEDTIQRDIFRMGFLEGPTEVAVSQMRRSGYFGLVFNFKPQKFLKSGDQWQEITSGTKLNNPTNQTALPLLRLYGTGTISFGGPSVTVSDADVYTDVDCELGDAYKGAINCNEDVSTNGMFPKLAPGETTVTFSGFSKVEVKPRWWRL